MELEQKEKMEKNKKLKLSLPYRIKPYNLITKTNPVQNLFSASPHNDGLDDDNGGDDFHNKKIKKNNIDDNDDEIKNENEKEAKISTGENEEEEEGWLK